MVFTVSLSDGVSLLDDYTSTVTGGGVTYNETLAEALALADSYIASNTYVNSLAEAVAMGDSAVAQLVILSTLAESVVVSDSVSAAQNHAAALAESITLGDSYTVSAIMVNALAETIALSAALGAGQVMLTVLGEQVTLLAAQSAAITGRPVYPDPSEVLLGVTYGPTGVEYTGTYTDAIRLELETGRLVKPIGSKLSILL